MEIPLLEIGDDIKRYRYSQLNITANYISLPNVRKFYQAPNSFCERSLKEWSSYFGFDVELHPNQKPASIGWVSK